MQPEIKATIESSAEIQAPVPTGGGQRRELRDRIRTALREQNAVLIAHYYVDREIQSLALETGGCVSDSLQMASFGAAHSADTLIIAGVRFMAETAKIITPRKRVLMVAPDAGCSLDSGCPADQFSAFCREHPERTVVVYANTSAAVKACADWVVTSSVAVDVVDYLNARGEQILWAPDRFLGDYVRRTTGADMVLWQGSCIVHEEFKARGIRQLRAVHPDAGVLAHPECPAAVLEEADFIGSTSQIIAAAKNFKQQKLIVATDRGLFYSLTTQVPHKQFILAPTAGEGATCRSCGQCPWMGMNHLQSLSECLANGSGEITVDPEIGQRALLPIRRMLDFSSTHQPSMSRHKESAA